MDEAVSVNEAIKRGQRKINYPSLAILLVGISLSLPITIALDIPPYYMFVVILIFFLLSFLLALRSVTRWRLWALENVRNVHELYDRARQEKLIPKDGSWINRIEIISKTEKERLRVLNEKFLLPDVFIDDNLIPEELTLYFSTGKVIFNIVIGAILASVGLFLFCMLILSTAGKTSPLALIAGLFMLALGCYLIYTGLIQLKDKRPQLTLSNLGIQEVNKEVVRWELISHATIRIQNNSRSSTYYFEYQFGDTFQSLDLEPFSINWRDLDYAVRIYKGRYEQSKNHSNYTDLPID